MSALSYLSGYGSNSEESDGDIIEPVRKRVCREKLPAPDLSKVLSVAPELHEDNPNLHGGRIRLFPHVRGNWATYVFVKYCAVDVIAQFVDEVEKSITTKTECHICDDIHISLSRTFVLKYHWISPFSTSLQQALKECKSFDLSFDSIKVFCNEDNSRTFIALEVDHLTHKNLLAISQKVDETLTEFQLPTFYKDPKFHMSILWVNGNKKQELTDILNSISDITQKNLDKIDQTYLVNTISCKIGNKYFEYSLE